MGKTKKQEWSPEIGKHKTDDCLSLLTHQSIFEGSVSRNINKHHTVNGLVGTEVWFGIFNILLQIKDSYSQLAIYTCAPVCVVHRPNPYLKISTPFSLWVSSFAPENRYYLSCFFDNMNNVRKQTICQRNWKTQTAYGEFYTKLVIISWTTTWRRALAPWVLC